MKNVQIASSIIYAPRLSKLGPNVYLVCLSSSRSPRNLCLLLFSIAFADQGLGARTKKKSSETRTPITQATGGIEANELYIRIQLAEAQGMVFLGFDLNSFRPESPFLAVSPAAASRLLLELPELQ